jgi:hypothetical protein
VLPLNPIFFEAFGCFTEWTDIKLVIINDLTLEQVIFALVKIRCMTPSSGMIESRHGLLLTNLEYRNVDPVFYITIPVSHTTGRHANTVQIDHGILAM